MTLALPAVLFLREKWQELRRTSSFTDLGEQKALEFDVNEETCFPPEEVLLTTCMGQVFQSFGHSVLPWDPAFS
jgi:hypothetical protein